MAVKIAEKVGAQKPAPTGKAHVIAKVIKNDTYMVLAQSEFTSEDEFKNFYWSMDNSAGMAILPPFEPKVLAKLVNQNNILSQCIDAMEVNIDGTGHEFVHMDDQKSVSDADKKTLESFFHEPYPGKSFLEMRRQLRRELEGIGYSFLECLRTLDGRLVGVRNTATYLTRLVRLDEEVMVKKRVERDGQEIELSVFERERRYVQRINNKNVYYREFGSTRQLHRETGFWETPANPVPAEKRASELIMFGLNKDIDTAYFTPRWTNQLPSVLGSRKAEEHNLEFFDSGGIPPAVIFVQGGTLAGDTADQLKRYMSGQTKSVHRAVVVEALSSSGSLDAAGTVQVKVERFGSETMKDAMFAAYDKASEEHVRTGFRLPPLFLGKAADYNFATAQVAYMVAEAQVFKPEREEFDAVINRTIVRELGVKEARFKSKPITLQDVQTQLKALEMAKDVAKGEAWMKELNTIASVTLEYDEEKALAAAEQAKALADAEVTAKTMPFNQQNQPPGGSSSSKSPKESNTQPPTKKPSSSTVVDFPAKSVKKATDLIRLAKDYAAVEGFIVQKQELSELDVETIREDVGALQGEDLEEFLGLMHAMTTGQAGASIHAH